VSFKECDATDDMMKWIFSQGKGFMKLSEYPDLCLGFTAGASKFTMQKCKFDSAGLADGNQMMSVIGLGFHEIKEDTPQPLVQNGWCVDRPYDKPTPGKSELNLYQCTKGDNQKYVWYNKLTWRYHYLLSHVDNFCMGVAGTSKPSLHSPITFKHCDDDDPNIRWEYSYRLSQLKMSSWPNLCLEYDDSIKAFAVLACTFLDGSDAMVLWPAHNQVIQFPGVQPEPEEDDDTDVLGAGILQHGRRRSSSRRRFSSRRRLKLYEVQESTDKQPQLEDKDQAFMGVVSSSVLPACIAPLLLLLLLLAVIFAVRRRHSADSQPTSSTSEEEQQLLDS